MRIDVILEGFRTAWNNEGDGLNVSVVDGLERTSELVLVGVDAALGDESDTALGISRLVFRKVFELVVLILVVANIAVTESVSSSCDMIEGNDCLTPCQQGTASWCHRPRKACRHQTGYRVFGSHQLVP